MAEDWDIALDVVSSLWVKYGPFDGLAGYSLGACLAAALASQLKVRNGGLRGLKFNMEL